jgi:hypothetical protein
VRVRAGIGNDSAVQLPTPLHCSQPRLRKALTCIDALVTADNRALNELGPYWKRASDASLTVYRA